MTQTQDNENSDDRHATEGPHDELVHVGVCPVCGDEFGDGFGDLEEGQQIDDVRVCIIEISDDSEEMADGIIHLPWEVGEA